MSVQPAALNGVRVVSLALNLPGPLAAARLTTLGAAVTKVEPPAGDPLSAVAPAWYADLASGQEVVTLDLKDPTGRADLEQRLAGADVLLTSMRPSALRGLRLDESAARHELVLVEIVGHSGDRAEQAGHDLTYQAAHGTLTAPVLPLVPVVDLLGAERAVSAVLAGVRLHDTTGRAVHERVVLDDVARWASAGVRHGLTGPGDPLGGGLATYDIYPTADGFVAVGALEPHFADRLAAAVGRTREQLTTRFASAPSRYWEDIGRSRDIPIVAVRTFHGPSDS